MISVLVLDFSITITITTEDDKESEMSDTLLMVADSERDANMLYATGLFVPDPFIYLQTGGRPLIVMSDLEIDRARAQAPHCRVASLSQYQQKLRAQGIKRPGLAHVVRQILREKGIRRVTVPDNFPLGLATDLEKLGVKVKARPGNFFPGTRNQIRRRSPENFRRAGDGRGRHGRGHAGPAPRPKSAATANSFTTTSR